MAGEDESCMVCDGRWDRGEVDSERLRVVRRVVEGWKFGEGGREGGCGVGIGWESGCCGVM